MEPTSAILATFGVILLVGSWIQLLIASFKEDFTWGLTSIFIPPLAYLYGLRAWDKAGDALIMAGIAIALLFFA